MSLFLSEAAVCDIRTAKVPNRLIAFGFAAGMAQRAFVSCPVSVREAIAASLLPVLLCWILFRIRALGAGDIKLFAVVGFFDGLQCVLLCMMASFLIGACYAALLLWKRRQMTDAFLDLADYVRAVLAEGRLFTYQPGRRKERQMHFSVMILFGYLCTLLWQMNSEEMIWGHIR